MPRPTWYNPKLAVGVAEQIGELQALAVEQQLLSAVPLDLLVEIHCHGTAKSYYLRKVGADHILQINFQVLQSSFRQT
jgi:hypothetical protein